MLTKQDLKQIKDVVQTEIQGIRTDLHSEIQGVKSDLHSEIQGVKSDLHSEIQGVRTDLKTEFKEELKKQLKPIKQDIIRIRKDQNAIIKFFNEEYLDLRTRIERIEDVLNLPPIPKTVSES